VACACIPSHASALDPLSTLSTLPHLRPPLFLSDIRQSSAPIADVPPFRSIFLYLIPPPYRNSSTTIQPPLYTVNLDHQHTSCYLTTTTFFFRTITYRTTLSFWSYRSSSGRISRLLWLDRIEIIAQTYSAPQHIQNTSKHSTVPDIVHAPTPNQHRLLLLAFR
jgi:hypothetical protein